jgi:hypothetical protein
MQCFKENRDFYEEKDERVEMGLFMTGNVS